MHQLPVEDCSPDDFREFEFVPATVTDSNGARCEFVYEFLASFATGSKVRAQKYDRLALGHDSRDHTTFVTVVRAPPGECAKLLWGVYLDKPALAALIEVLRRELERPACGASFVPVHRTPAPRSGPRLNGSSRRRVTTPYVTIAGDRGRVT